jgi:hypothetical protein
MKKQLKLSKVAEIATGAAFLFFCLLNLKTVFNNNGKVGKSNSDEALAIDCWDNPPNNNGDCTKLMNGSYMCEDSLVFHDCVQGYFT